MAGSLRRFAESDIALRNDAVWIFEIISAVSRNSDETPQSCGKVECDCGYEILLE